MAVKGIDDVPLLDRQMLPAACRSSGAHFKGARSWEEDVPLELTYLWTVDFRAAPVACSPSPRARRGKSKTWVSMVTAAPAEYVALSCGWP